MDELRKLIEAAKGVVENHHDCYDENAQRVGVLIDDLDALRAALPAAEAELAGMGEAVEALTRIAHPIEALLNDTPKGHVFDGEVATRITDNPHWARDIALKALAAFPAPPSEPEEKL